MRKAFWTYLVAGVAVLMVSMDNLIVTNALPAIRTDLDTGLEGLEWTVNAYTLSFAVFLLTGAALGDRFGRRRMLAIGLAVFTAASAAAALAPGIGTLIGARAVQGFGGALVMPLTLTLIASVTPPQRRGLALGLWGAMSGLGVALGPVIGGGITQYSSWQWIFWINVPIGILLLPVVALVRESRGGAGRLDPIGVVLVTAGIFGIVFGLVRGEAHGWTSAQVLTSLIGGAALMVAFVAWQARARAPMVPLALFRDRGFGIVNAVSLVMAFGMFGSVFLGAQYLQLVLGFSPFEAGLRSLPWTAVPAVSAPIAGLLTDRIGARRIIAVAMALQAVGIGWLALESSTTLPYARLIAPFVISGLGMGLFFAPMARLTLSYAPRHLEGVASGTSNALRQLGTVFGIAVLGSIFAAYGGYETVDAFVAGVVPAMKVGAVVLAAGVVLILLAPVRRHAVESVEESGDVAGRDIKEPADAVAVLEPAGR
jgi:EmrB/QacA subfamily drug resistance transporter